MPGALMCVLRWKPDGRNDGKFFLGCSNYRATKCKAKGCGGNAYSGGSEITVSESEPANQLSMCTAGSGSAAQGLG